MNLFNKFRDDLENILQKILNDGLLPFPENDDIVALDFIGRMTLEPPRDPLHGDMSSNLAMILSKPLKMPPRDIATLIVPHIKAHEAVKNCETAGPGFINIFFHPNFWTALIPAILKANNNFGASNLGQGEKVNIEYVSVNPTGPLHIGHVRGATFGDALSELLRFTGHDVLKEYYVNDAGAQVDILAKSVHLRYLQLHGIDIGDIPDGLYPGEYIIDVARQLKDEYGDIYKNADEEVWRPLFRQKSVDAMLAIIKQDLHGLNVHQDVFTSEKELIESGLMDEVEIRLNAENLLYTGILEAPKGKQPDDWEPREQLLFKSTQFGDDLDRPLKKSDGSWTYFASDIANHLGKFKRGYAKMLNVFGADHAGYVTRLEAATRAITGKKGDLKIHTCQIVRFMEGGNLLKMSKRAGNFVTMRELVDAVGADAVRIFMLTRKNAAQLDFDLKKVVEENRDNPVFYIQYAHARSYSLCRMAHDAFPDIDFDVENLKNANISLLRHEDELQLIQKLAQWPRLVETAALHHEPHRLVFYIYELAGLFHSLWHKGKGDADLRFVVLDDINLTRARMALVLSVRLTIQAASKIIGFTPLSEMN